MRKLIPIFIIAMTVLPGAGQAQVTIDMSRITCANYLAMPPEQTSTFSAWMSGWYNHKWGYISVGLNDFARNIASIKQFCTTSPQETIMAALNRAVQQPAPATGQIKIDMSLITCKQYLGSDAERKKMIGAWMSGYLRASTNQTIFDFQKFANNKRSVGNYCKKRSGETLMSAIQKSTG
jgi:hypothetical protein